MIKNKNILSSVSLLVVALLLVINIGMLISYLFYGYQAEFHSDSAVKVLLAKEIVLAKDYFPDDWNYINNDLFVFFGHTFIIPLLAVMPAGFTAHAIAGLFFSILLLTGVWFLSGLSGLSATRRFLILAIVAAGISSFSAENLYGQVSYCAEIVFCCYLIFFSCKFFQSKDKLSYVWGIGVFLLVLFMYWENPQRATIVYGIPFLGAVCWQSMQENAAVRKKLSKIFIIFFMGLGVGVVLHISTLSGVNNILTVGNVRWLSYEMMLRNLSLTPKGILYIFGALPNPGDYLVSLDGVFDALRLLAAAITAVLVPWAVFKVFRYSNDGMGFFGSFVAIAFVSVFFLYVTTTIPDMSDPIQVSRYLLPSLFLGLIILLMSPIDRRKAPISAISTIFIIVFFITSGYQVFRLSGKEVTIAWGQPGQYNPHKKSLVDFLVSRNLEYGYATFWYAGALSVLSDEKVLVRQISINNGIPMPQKHLSSNRWYRPDAWHGETFLLLTEAEAKLIKWGVLEAYNVKPDRTYEINGFNIYVFKDNLSNNLPGWDAHFEVPFKFMVNEYALKQVGHFDKEENALVAEQGESGALHYGPYITVEPGRYMVTFDILAGYNPNGVVRLDVVGGNDQIHAEATLTSSEKPQQLYFTLDEVQTMEFRVWALGNERLVLKGVTIERLPSVNAQ